MPTLSVVVGEKYKARFKQRLLLVASSDAYYFILLQPRRPELVSSNHLYYKCKKKNESNINHMLLATV